MTQMANMYFYFLFVTCFVVVTTAKEETNQQLILTTVSRSPSASHDKREALKSLTLLNRDLVNKRIMTKVTIKQEADRTLVESVSKSGDIQSLIAADEDVTVFIQNATANDTKGYTDKVLKNNTYGDKYSSAASPVTVTAHNTTRDVPSYVTDTHYDHVTEETAASSKVSVPTSKITSKSDKITMESSSSYYTTTPVSDKSTRKYISPNSTRVGISRTQSSVTSPVTQPSMTSPITTTEITSDTVKLKTKTSTFYGKSTPVSDKRTSQHSYPAFSTVRKSTTRASVTSPVTQPPMTSSITTTEITSDTVKLTTETSTFYGKSTPVSDKKNSEYSSPAFSTVRKSTTRASLTSPVTQPPMTSSITTTVNVCDGMCNQGQCILLKNVCECGKYFHGTFCQFVHLDLVDYTVYGTSITIHLPEPLPFYNFVFKYYEKYNPRPDVMERNVTSSTTPVSEVTLSGLKGGMVQYIICIISKGTSEEEETASPHQLFDLFQENSACLTVKTGFSKSDPYTVAFYITGTLLVFVLVVIFLAQFVLDLDRTIERNSQKTSALQKLKKMSRRFTKRHAGGKEFRKPQPTALATVSPPPHEEYHPDLSTDTSDIDGSGPVKMLRRFSKRVVSGRKASQNYPLVRMTRLGQKSRPSEVGTNQREMQAHRAVPPAKPPRKGPINSRPNSTKPPRKDPMKLKPDSGGCYPASVYLENEQRRPKKMWARKVVSSAVPHKMYNFDNKIEKQMRSEELVVKAAQRQYLDTVKLGANNVDNPQRRPPNRMKKGRTRYLISNEGLRHGVRCSEQDIEDADRRAKYFSRFATSGGVAGHNKAPEKSRAHKRLIHNHRQNAEDSEPLQADHDILRVHDDRRKPRPTEHLIENVGELDTYSSHQLQSKNKRLVENGAEAAPNSYVNPAFEYGSSNEEETSLNDRGMERSSPTFKEGVADRRQGFPKSPTRSYKHDREDVELHLNDGKRHGLNISPPSAEDVMADRRHGVAGRRHGYPGTPQRHYQYDRERVIPFEHENLEGTESDGTSSSSETYPDYESDSVHEEAIPYDNHMFTPITSQTSNLENSKPLTSRAEDGHEQLANDTHCRTLCEVGAEDYATQPDIEVDLDEDASYSSFQTGSNRRSKRPRILAMSPEFSPICEFEEMCGDYSASDEEID